MTGGGGDIGRIVSLIMENPQLIEEISRLANGDRSRDETPTPVETPPEAPTEESEAVLALPQQSAERGASEKNRSRLLGALKPYVSKERAQAIDSMLSVVEILDAMKGR